MQNGIRALNKRVSGRVENRSQQTTVVIFREYIGDWAHTGTMHDMHFRVWDDGDVFSSLPVGSCLRDAVRGMVVLVADTGRVPVPPATTSRDIDVYVVVADPTAGDTNQAFHPDSVKAFVRDEAGWSEAAVELVPDRREVFSRHHGILENGALKDAYVLFFGEGSVGSVVTLEHARCGVGHLGLFDADRLHVGNIGRYVSGLPDVGRLKVHIIRDRVHEINPYAEVKTFPVMVDWSNEEMVREEIRRADLVICGADERVCRMIVNKLCVEEGKPYVMGGARTRGYGLQAFVFRPRQGPCYQDFLMDLPRAERDKEVSSPRKAASIAYSDKPVAVEAGLSLDLAPLSIMMAKLGLHELLRGKSSTLHCLDEDLTPSLYFFLNRREIGTPFENLPPMGFDRSGLSVLRWFGVPLKRYPGCPVCSEDSDETGNDQDETQLTSGETGANVRPCEATVPGEEVL